MIRKRQEGYKFNNEYTMISKKGITKTPESLFNTFLSAYLYQLFQLCPHV